MHQHISSHTSDEHCDAIIPRSVSPPLVDGKIMSYNSIACQTAIMKNMVLIDHLSSIQVKVCKPRWLDNKILLTRPSEKLANFFIASIAPAATSSFLHMWEDMRIEEYIVPVNCQKHILEYIQTYMCLCISSITNYIHTVGINVSIARVIAIISVYCM